MNDPAVTSAPVDRRICMYFTPEEADDILNDLPLGHSVSQATRDLFVRLRAARRTAIPGELMTPTYDNYDDGVIHAPPQPVRPSPERMPCRVLAIRQRDVTGVSGVGHIAELFVASDGATAIRWLGGPPQDQPKWEFYDKPGTAPFEQISGHNGNTELVWIDDPHQRA